jgi:hypothetical protein
VNTPNPLPADPKNQWAAYALIAFVGMGSGFGGGSLSRTDPWTGADDHHAMEDLRTEFVELIREERARNLEYFNTRMRPFDEHLARASEGWDYIYELRADVKAMKQEIEHIRNDQIELKNQLMSNGMAH